MSNPKIHIKRGCGNCKYWLPSDDRCLLRVHIVAFRVLLCSDYKLDWTLYDLIMDYIKHGVNHTYRKQDIAKGTLSKYHRWWWKL